MNNQIDKNITTRSVSFVRRDKRTQAARMVFDHYLTLDDPDIPETKLIPQQILTEALIALGEKSGVVSSEHNIDHSNNAEALIYIANSLAELKDIVTSQYKKLEEKIYDLASRGVITDKQAKQVTEVIDNETKSFAENMGKSLKGGKKL